MKNDVVQLILYLFVLVVGAALEELLPKFGGVGFPLLLASAVALAARRRRTVALLFALAAGAVEDSLSGLPPATTSSFLVLVCVLSRRVATTFMMTMVVAVAYLCYQLWLALWVGGLGGATMIRMASALPTGAVAALAASFALTRLERKAAVDEA